MQTAGQDTGGQREGQCDLPQMRGKVQRELMMDVVDDGFVCDDLLTGKLPSVKGRFFMV
jgi:hypothetical protein